MTARRWTHLVALAAWMAACGGDSGQTWVDVGQRWSDEVYPTVFEGDGYSIGDGSYQSGRETYRCAQIVIDDTPLDCVHVDGALSSTAARIGDTRFAAMYTGAEVTAAVAWSSLKPDGELLDVVEAGAGSTIVWIMQPGEEPWGVQLLRADGTLAWSSSYVGLPGE